MPAPHGLIERLAEMAAEGQPFVLVTLVEAVGSTPQDAGTKMLVDVSGLRFGTVGGGKVEQQAIATAQALLADPEAKPCTLAEWNLKRDVGMTCGGTVKFLFEAYHVHPWRVVVFGAGHVGQAVVRCLLLLDCEVACIDSRHEWLGRLPDAPQLEKLIGPVKVLLDAYSQGKVNAVYMCYTKFINTMRQEPVVEKLLPLDKLEADKGHPGWDYIYEPDAQSVIDDLLVRYVEALVYQAVAENMASEQSARMVAMKSATDNAGNVISELKLIYNKTRQAAITKELSEIVAGAAAV